MVSSSLPLISGMVATKQAAGSAEETKQMKIAVAVANLLIATCVVAAAGFAASDGVSFSDLLEGWPNEKPSRGAKVFYIVDSLAFLAKIPMLFLCGRSDTSNMLWRPGVKRNFLIMLMHHNVALLLLGCSYMANLWKFGVVLGLLLQPAEIFLELWNLARYCNAGYWVRSLVISLHLAEWLALHLVAFVAIVLRSSISSAFLPARKHPVTLTNAFIYLFFNIQLLFLLVATLVWTVFAARVWHRTVFGEAKKETHEE